MSVNLKHSTVLKGMFSFKPATLCVERYHNVVTCAVFMEDLIQISFYKLNTQDIFLTYFIVHFAGHLTKFWATSYVYISLCS
jgi:hypothetical protein